MTDARLWMLPGLTPSHILTPSAVEVSQILTPSAVEVSQGLTP